MKAYIPSFLFAFVAVVAIASVTVMVIYSKVNGEAAFGLLSAIIGAGVLHAGVSTGSSSASQPPPPPA